MRQQDVEGSIDVAESTHSEGEKKGEKRACEASLHSCWGVVAQGGMRMVHAGNDLGKAGGTQIADAMKVNKAIVHLVLRSMCRIGGEACRGART